MTSTIVLTAGTSILDNLKEEPCLVGVVERLRLPEEIAELLEPPTDAWRGVAGNGQAPGAVWFLDHYGRQSPTDGKTAPRHAAELASLALLRPTPEDDVVFLCSETPDGLFAALVAAHLIRADDDDPIRVFTGPADRAAARPVNWGPLPGPTHADMPRAGRGRVSLHVISGLNPVRRDQFETDGAGNLVRAFVLLAREAAESKRALVLNVTGGYKAAIPLLTMVASWLTGDVKLVALYQDSRELLRIPVLPAAPDRALWNGLQADLANRALRPEALARSQQPLVAAAARGGLQLSLLGRALEAYVQMMDRSL